MKSGLKRKPPRKEKYTILFSFYVTADPDVGARAASDLGMCDLVARKVCAMPECVIVEIGVETYSNCMNKKKTFKIPTCTFSETAMLSKIVIIACIFIQSTILYQQSQSE